MGSSRLVGVARANDLLFFRKPACLSEVVVNNEAFVG